MWADCPLPSGLWEARFRSVIKPFAAGKSVCGFSVELPVVVFLGAN